MQVMINKDTSKSQAGGYLMRIDEVLKIIPFSRSTWYGGVKNGLYPQPVKIGVRAVAWRSDDIFKLLEEINSGEFSKKLESMGLTA